MSFTHGKQVVCKAFLVSDLLLSSHAVSKTMNERWQIRSNPALFGRQAVDPTRVRMDRLTLMLIIIIIIIIIKQYTQTETLQ
jgi:hypothetical protein